MAIDDGALTEHVLARIGPATPDRLREVMEGLIRHLHAFVRETRLTEQEWMQAIQFLTATGQKCDDRRQEFILLSDTLGVSMLVDAIAHPFPQGATETTVLGPFFVDGAPETPYWGDLSAGAPGLPCFVSGTVAGPGGAPLAGALIDVWQSDGEQGVYDVQSPGGQTWCRGKVRTDAQGRFAFRTVQPVSYPVPTDGPVGQLLLKLGRHPYRPAHIHTRVSCPGYADLTTHLFVRGDPYLASDAVFGVKESLVVDFVRHDAGPSPDGGQCPVPFSTARYDFVLTPESTLKDLR